MLKGGEILQRFQAVMRLFELSGKDVCEKYGLTQIESNILMFLNNNPGKDTASDIVDLRRLPKANVSKAVESLIQKELLLRRQDTGDRRRIHLMLTDDAQKMIPDISAVLDAFSAQLFSGFTLVEQKQYADMNVRIWQNALEGLERK
ncbi:MAG: MarR family transcriptional regulator [Negativicutes bacterium]|nr:MarR family transcriptional regulator [Negativicutes bacterium]